MGEVKWIKLSVDVFNDEKLEAIQALPDSNDIQLAWIKLLCLAGKCNEGGLLMVTSELPYTDEMLAKRFDMEIGVVQRALAIFQKLEMLSVVEDVYLVSNWSKYQNTGTLEGYREKNRERQKKFRERKKQELLEQREESVTLQNNVKVTLNDSISLSDSYSFNNHNNLMNYQYLINNDLYIDSIYIKGNPALDDLIQDWMKYKDGCKPKSKNKYSSEQSMSKMLTIIVKHDKEYGTDAVRDAIDMSIANQWQGIYWDKIEKNGKQRKPFSQPKEKSKWQ